MSKAGLLVLVSAVLILCLGPSAWAAEPYAAQGIYLGVNYNYNMVGGDLTPMAFINAPSAIVNAPAEEIFISEPDDGSGWGASVGYRGPNYALELAFQTSDHDHNGFLGEGSTRIDILSLDLKYFFLSDKRVQPYFLIGAGYIWVKQKESAFTPDFAAATSVSDAELKNFCFDVGGGISFLLSRRLALNGGVVWRLTRFNRVDGEFNWELDSSLDFNLLTFSAGLTYTLPMNLK